MANPDISAKIFAPLARACSNSSNTKTAAPSPCTIPFLVAQKGLHPSWDITLRPSQAFIPPKQSILSDPPAIITFAAPDLIK